VRSGSSSRSLAAASPAAAAAQKNLQRAYELLRSGRYADAETICRGVLDRAPNHPFAYDILGLIAQRQDALPQALMFFERAIAADGRQPVFRQHVASVYFVFGRHKDAIAQLLTALKLKPDFIEASCDLAKCYLFQGKFDEAVGLFRRALAVAPNNPTVIFESASGLATAGFPDEAKALLRRAAETGIEAPNAYFELSKIETSVEALPELDKIEALLKDGTLSAMQRSMLHLAAGKVASRRKLFDQAFEHYRQAKAPFAWAFDIKRNHETHQRLRELYNREFFEERKGFGSASSRPVFIVGMPRSGTSLTEQILASHRDVAAGGELSEIGRIAASAGRRPTESGNAKAAIASLSTRDTQALANEYLSFLRGISADAPRVTDKMPQNFLHLGLIALLFPNAKIIHCRRDPLDTCLSCFMTGFPGTRHAYAAKLDTLGAYYADYAALMDHWRMVLPIPIFEVQYEDLVTAPEETIRALVDHVGLEWDDACLNFHETSRVMYTASRYQATQPIHRGSIGRWRDSERHLGPLKEALGPLASER
jgi:tetratricopeptide (TPR) repeat protein